MSGALSLVAYSLKTWQTVIDEGAADQRGATALRLYEWLATRPGWCEPLVMIVNKGPACVRTKDRRDGALSKLEAVGLVRVGNGEAQALVGPATDKGQA